MPYWAIGLLSIAIHLIVNHDVLWEDADAPDASARRSYRAFLLAVLAYFVTDAIWGVLESLHLSTLLFVDTTAYFVAMAVSVQMWTQYVVDYLDEKGVFATALLYAGRIFVVLQLIVLVVNCFTHIMFWVDVDGTYHAEPFRYASFQFQLVLFILTAAYTLFVTGRTHGAESRRNLTIGLFGVTMALLIGAQIAFPLLSLYAMGYVLGSCVLHAFVLEDERNAHQRELESSLERERAQRLELEATRKMAYTDSLTGVRGKRAYDETEERMDSRIANGELTAFAIAVFDLNGLKYVNDTLGHDAGDRYIVSACRLICNHFKHSPVFRIGGDEFVAIMEGADYENRNDLLQAFNQQAEVNLGDSEVVVSSGMAEFVPGQDKNCQAVFDRADSLMYERKRALQALGARTRDEK